MKKILYSLLVCFPLILMAQKEHSKQYIFTAHTYDSYSYDNRLKQINIKEYDGIFLGGDILSEASLSRDFLEDLDSLVDLSSPMTLWALGNHDSRNGNWDWISEYTKKKTYAAHFQDESVFMMINTNIVPYDCEELEDEFYMLKTVCDTISVAKNLLLFMHHVIWDGVPGLQAAWMTGHVNPKYWLANCDSANAHFYNTVYPLLKNVKEKGIEVFVVAGDMGTSGKKKYFEQSSDGINFLGCGLYHGDPQDVVLIFDNKTGAISFQFCNLDSLVSVSQNLNKQ